MLTACVCWYSRKSSPDTRNPLSTKNRSTPTQPPRNQARMTASSPGQNMPGTGGFMCRPMTSVIATARNTSSDAERVFKV